MNAIPRLADGDAVAVVATARKVTKADMQPALDMLAGWGYRVVPGPNLYAADRQFAGTDAQRAADLQWALDDGDVKAVLFARGGYGTVRLLDRIDFSGFAARPKWLIGFSDITVLHSHIQRTLGLPTVHGPMASTLATSHPETKDILQRILRGALPPVRAAAAPLNRPGAGRGVLTGGNLSILYALSGTPSDIDTRGKILFLEDLDEHLYHVDRMMMNLKQSGKLEGLAGLVVGDVSSMRDNTTRWGFAADNPFGRTAEEIIREHADPYDFPVCFRFPAGHTDRNTPLVLGMEAALAVDDAATLTYDGAT
jgi:muramoyltetrapeptide carboxypeptidase